MRPHPSISTDSNDQPHQIDPFAPSPFEVKNHTNRSTGSYAAVTVIAWIVGGLYFGLIALRPLPWILWLYAAGLLIACVAGFTALYMVLGRKYFVWAIVAGCVILVLCSIGYEVRIIAALIVTLIALLGNVILPFVGAAYLIITLYMVLVVVTKWAAKHKPARTLVSNFAVMTLLMLTFSALAVSVSSFSGTIPQSDTVRRLDEKIYVVVHEVSGLFGAPRLGLYECGLLGFPCERLWEVQYDSVVPESDVRLSADGTAIELLILNRLAFTYQPEPASPP